MFEACPVADKLANSLASVRTSYSFKSDAHSWGYERFNTTSVSNRAPCSYVNEQATNAPSNNKNVTLLRIAEKLQLA